MLQDFAPLIVAPMTTNEWQVEAMLQSPFTDGFADLSVVFRYDVRDPFAIRIIFEDQVEWTMSLELFGEGACGRSAGHGDIVWSPNFEIAGCMNLFLKNGEQHATMVFSTQNLQSVWEAIPEMDDAVRAGVNHELDIAISRMLGDS